MVGGRRALVAVLATSFTVLAFGQPIEHAATPQLALTGFVTNPPPARGYNTLASVSDDGGPLIDWSDEPQISGDGRWQVFTTDSYACDGCFGIQYSDPDPLDPGSDVRRIFVRNLDPNATDLHRTIQVSIGSTAFPSGATLGSIITPDGADPDSYAEQGSISANGRYVSFVTYATNIVPAATGGQPITLVVCDRDPDGDGNYDELIPGGTQGTQTRDYRCRGIVSTLQGAQGGVDLGSTPRLSPDGSQIVYVSPNDFNGTDVMIAKVSDSHGLLTAQQAGQPVKVNGIEAKSVDSEPAIASLGYVVMRSVKQDGTETIVRTNLVTSPQQVTRVDTDPTDPTKYLGDRDYSCDSGGCSHPTIDMPTISNDGSTVLFHYGGEDQDPTAPRMVLVRDVGRGTGFQTAEVISRGNATAADPDGPEVDSELGALSGDGRFAVFQTSADDVHDGTPNTTSEGDQLVARDVLRDLVRKNAGLPRLAGALVTNSENTPDVSGPADPCSPVPPALYCDSYTTGDFEAISVSGDGSRVSFNTDQDDLVPGGDQLADPPVGDVNGEGDVYVHTFTPQLTNGTSDLGDIQVNTRTQGNLPVQAIGFGPVNFDFAQPPTLGGQDADQFAISSTTCGSVPLYADFSLSGSTQCVISVEFRPTSLGTKTATISLLPRLYQSKETVGTVTATAVATGPTVAPGDTTRTSVRNNGGQSPTGGRESMISGNGRWQVFESDSELTGRSPVAPDPEFEPQNVFVRDLADPQHTVQISLHTAATPDGDAASPWRPVAVTGHPRGASPNDNSFEPSISADGRFVSFMTTATDVVPAEFRDGGPIPGFFWTVVVCDRDPDRDGIFDELRKGTQVPDYRCFAVESGSFSVDGPSADRFTTPRLAGNGTRLTWVEDDSDADAERAVVSTLLKTPGGALQPPSEPAYVPINGVAGFTASATAPDFDDALQADPRLTEDGGAVVFSAEQPCCQNTHNVAVIETTLADGQSTRFDTTDNGATFLGDSTDVGGSFDPPAVSGDGTRVAFAFRGPNDDVSRVYVATLAGGVIDTIVASLDTNGRPSPGEQPALSGNGRYLAFQTSRPNESNAVDPPGGSCFVNDTDGQVNCQIVARDLVKDAADRSAGRPLAASEIVSSSISKDCVPNLPAGRVCGADDNSFNPSIDQTGSEVGFDSQADDIVPNDDNVVCDEGCSPATDAFVHTWRPTLATPSFDFGAVRLGEHATKTFTVTEQALPGVDHIFGPISLGSTSIMGTNAADFTLVSTTCTGKTLNDGDSCKYKIRFAPADVGNRAATLSTAVGKNGYPRRSPNNVSFDPPPTLPAALAGRGTQTRVGAVTVDPSTLDFGKRLPLAPGLTKTVTLTNTGSGSVDVTDVTVSDTTHPGASGDYTVDASGCVGVLLPGASCAITVTFVGHAVGNRGAQLVITSDVPTSPTTVTLLARVPKPTVTANPGVSPPGRVTLISGTGFAPHRLVDIGLKGFGEHAEVKTDGHGEFEVGLVIFRNTPEGPQTVTAHSRGVSKTISATGPLLLAVGSVDILDLVTRH